MGGVIALGIAVSDLVLRPIDGYPPRGALSLVRGMGWSPGGCALNVAFVLRKLGADVGLVASLGNDPPGDWLAGECSRRGIDTRGVVRADTFTATSVVLVSSDGERTFLHYPGANRTLSERDIDFDSLRKVRVLYVGGVYGLESLDPRLPAVLAKAKAVNRDLIIVMDVIHTGQRGSRLIDPALPFVDYFIPNINEGRDLSGESDARSVARYFRMKGARNVIITLGPQGSFLYNDEIAELLEPFPVEAMDTTGAGDAFAGGLILGLSQGWGARRSARFGNATGALSVRGIGASDALHSLEDAIAFMTCAGREGTRNGDRIDADHGRQDSAGYV